MLLTEIRKVAEGLGLRPGRMNKGELIRAIQRVEGNFDCYGTALSGHCDQGGCLWREECLMEERRPKTAGPKGG